MSKDKRICTQCILDSDIPNISFDEKGICNYCHTMDRLDKAYPLGQKTQNSLEGIIDKVKISGKGKDYDCIVGVSGGADSTYVLYLTKKYGLRPLAVHCDNGWNTELAVSNIKNMLNILGVDLYTNVINWEEFKELQKAFFKASVPDVETISDRANLKTLYHTAAKYGIKYIIKGNNFRTEGIMPRGWTYYDSKYFNAIRKKFSNVKVKNYPLFTDFHYLYYMKFKRIKIIKILNYVNYNKKSTKATLQKELQWRDYGGKHYESIFTRFFQSYFLPKKFNIDKRMIHLSALICSGQITRQEALDEMSLDPHPPQLIDQDIEYIHKKWGLSKDEFDQIFNQKPKSFRDYPNRFKYIQLLKKLRKLANPNVMHRP